MKLRGSQEPTHRLVAPHDYSRGLEVLELAQIIGLQLDPWQTEFLHDACAIGPRDRWASKDVAIELSRQNGKSIALMVRSLADLYLFGSKLVVYSAHRGETVGEMFRLAQELIEGTPELDAEVRRFSLTNGKEFVELKSRARMVFRTRTSGGGRGLSGDLVVLDEAQDLTDDHIAALAPTLVARPNPQLLYAGSAGGPESTVLGRLVRRLEAGDRHLTMWRWAASEDDDSADPRTHARVNPAYGIRIDPEDLEAAQSRMSPEGFAREHLGIGDYPVEDGEEWVIPKTAWDRCEDLTARVGGQLVFAADAKPDGTMSSIGVAGLRADGSVDVEVVAHEPGIRWVIPRLVELSWSHGFRGIVIDGKGPLAGQVPDLIELLKREHSRDPVLVNGSSHGGQRMQDVIAKLDGKRPVVLVTGAEDMVQACAWLHDATTGEPPMLWHRGAPKLTSALASAKARQLLNGWALRRQGQADISPLVSALLAGYGQKLLGRRTHRRPPPPPQKARGSRRGVSETADLMTVGF